MEICKRTISVAPEEETGVRAKRGIIHMDEAISDGWPIG
jgi:hypothetical protein